MRILKNSNFDFMSKKVLALGLSAIIVFSGLLSLFINGGPKLSMDFKGGTFVAVQYSEEINVNEVRNTLGNINIDGQSFDFSKEEVKHFGSKSAVSLRIPHIENSPANFSQKIVIHLFDSFPSKTPDDITNFILSKGVVSPKIGSELSGKAVMAIISALGLIMLYISVRFEFKFALGAIAALTHDVLITLGMFSLLSYEISLPIIAAFLTIVGYSLNDTIVIFDRIRENLKSSRNQAYTAVVNTSINESLSRTVITSLTTFVVVFILWVFGGEVIHNFAFAMIVGVIVGTYSSIYIASTLVIYLHERSSN
mgnify:FL=1|tara:strand:+ start:8969 stop:9898 length:930 start_codon:yes stop_codon:yes gene_type:complete